MKHGDLNYASITREDFDLQVKIVERAERMGLFAGTRCTAMMDVGFAHAQFNMCLQMWLDADDENFAHDFCGIHRHINRETCRVEDFFLPRYAGSCHGKPASEGA